jgi:FKBP-type peptidyl-prolyl cis-trans isomerase
MSTDEVQIKDIEVGQGIEASKGALCFVQYTGYLEDGTKFDSTLDHGRSFEFVIGSKKVIVGWSQGMLGMKVGGKRQIFIPAHLAYGERQVGEFIKPNSNLIFHVELQEVRPRE